MLLVSLQVGIQPQVTRACVASLVSGQSLVLAEMCVSIIFAVLLLPNDAFASWSSSESLMLVGPPATLYAMRSLLKQAAYRRCDGVTFNIMNQTKVVFCAIAAWLLLGEAQTTKQCIALLCATAASALLVTPAWTNGANTGTDANDKGTTPPHSTRKHTTQNSAGNDSPRMGCGAGRRNIAEGLRPCISGILQASRPERKACSSSSGGSTTIGALLALATAACSGVAAALSQAAMRHSSRPSTMFNLELGLWGLPFVVLSGRASCSSLSLRGWQACTMAPVALQAVGGLLVSALVKKHGGVVMGLCTVIGITISAVVDALLMRKLPSQRQIVAAMLCVLSVLLYQRDTPPHESLENSSLKPNGA